MQAEQKQKQQQEQMQKQLELSDEEERDYYLERRYPAFGNLYQSATSCDQNYI